MVSIRCGESYLSAVCLYNRGRYAAGWRHRLCGTHSGDCARSDYCDTGSSSGTAADQD